MGPETDSEGRRLPLSERWRPRTLKELTGQPEAVQKLKAFGESWIAGPRPPRLRAALLEGTPGVGKTTAALALAADMGWGVVEMNASDARNKSAIEQVAGRASLTNTFTEDGRFLSAAKGQRNLILLDEADCLSTRASKGSSTDARAPPSFRDFLRSRYRSVEALNDAWGFKAGEEPAPFASWDSLPPSPGRAGWARRPAVQRDLQDWRGSSETKDLSDRGGLGAVTKLVKETLQPLILTVNDSRPLVRASSTFRTGVVRVRFYPVRPESVRGLLHRVSMAENFGVSDANVDAIVDHVKGDLRAALNDLETVAALPPAEDASEVLGRRDLESNLFEATERFLSHGRFLRSSEIIAMVDATPDDLLPWIEENLPAFASGPGALADGLEMLARAQRHLARANRNRAWSLWSYASELMTGGVGVALHPEGAVMTSGRPTIEFPRFLAGMGWTKGARAVRGSLLEKLGRAHHLSRRKAREGVLPTVERLFRENHATHGVQALQEQHHFQLALVQELALEPNEVAYLLGREEEDAAVTRLFQEARGVPESDVEEESPSAPSTTTPKRGQRKLF